MVEFFGSILRRPPMGWWDLVDIAIVSFLVYEFLLLIRGTRAVQMGVGTLLIVAMFYISRLAPLQTVNWLIRNMLLYVAFAAIVIFQSDIRRALAHFGQAPFFRYFNRQEAADETIEEIVVAATMLSSQKVGAIIAVEREIGLRNYIESGIRSARDNFSPRIRIARRRRDHPGEPGCGGRVLSAADRQPQDQS
jgi:diadenylate cyclase